MTLLTESLREAELGDYKIYRFANAFKSALEDIWNQQEAQTSWKTSYQNYIKAPPPLFSRSKTPSAEWLIAFTPGFNKSISDIDKKLQGRVLTAITELSEKPVLPHGDTRKPLGADLKGLWRYRVGDYRLVYRPDEEKHLVILLEFAARGGVYES